MKKIIVSLLFLLAIITDASAVLKEQGIAQTLNVLRTELTQKHNELTSQAEERKEEARKIVDQLKETINRSNQNALMLYSQNSSYVFDMTYACHEATEQYQSFQKQQLPFKDYLEDNNLKLAEIKIYEEEYNKKPILLLDDIFSELDSTKKTNIIKFIKNDLQVFITSTDLNNIDKKIIKEADIYKIDNGKVVEGE